MTEQLSYRQAGVDIDATDAAKQAMAASMRTTDSRVLNRLGPFASLFDARFPGYEHPVLVLKIEEPGSKQLLAFQHDRVETIAHDTINHLTNDVIVMGAEPLAALDAVICGQFEPAVVTRLVAAFADACRAQGCALVGGETSVQPGVLGAGSYVLVASMVGVVEKSKIIDGARIAPGDRVLALASNGPHTNGYTLIRALMDRHPELLDRSVDGVPFLDAILAPHQPYYPAVREARDWPEVRGLAHITGGGIAGNLSRILPATVDARIDLTALRVPAIFRLLREVGDLETADMVRTFNMGAGLVAVVAAEAAERFRRHVEAQGYESYAIGEIVRGGGQVVFDGRIAWDAAR